MVARRHGTLEEMGKKQHKNELIIRVGPRSRQERGKADTWKKSAVVTILGQFEFSQLLQISSEAKLEPLKFPILD